MSMALLAAHCRILHSFFVTITIRLQIPKRKYLLFATYADTHYTAATGMFAVLLHLLTGCITLVPVLRCPHMLQHHCEEGSRACTAGGRAADSASPAPLPSSAARCARNARSSCRSSITLRSQPADCQ